MSLRAKSNAPAAGQLSSLIIQRQSRSPHRPVRGREPAPA
nr:MAG TPA: hypothetical protein [Caudoviricetes sp.]